MIAGRASAFSDAEIIRLAREDFIAVSADDWYERRRDDAVGTFFRRVADQGPRKGEHGATRQGIYCLTADGTLLAYRNAGQNADVMRAVLKQALAAWQKLPAARRRPGAVKVGDPGPLDPRYSRTVPPGTAVVRVFTRILDRDDRDDFGKGSCPTLGGDKAARDHLWLTAADVKAMAPAKARAGDTFPLPAAVGERIARFHLVDNTRGEPPMWTRQQVRRCDLTLKVTKATGQRVEMRLEGAVLLATAADAAAAERGFDACVLGYVVIDREKMTLERFDLVALGDHWGEGPFTPNARKGRKPLGISFELAGAAAGLVPPQGAREIGAYLGADK